MELFLLFAVGWLAFANGANDNFKGVATLYGCGAASYRRALAWATAATLAGGLVSVWMAHGLVDAFRGAGLVPLEVAGRPEFALAVAGSAGLTILIATRAGMPTSTTHALIGALLGAGAVAATKGLNFGPLAHKFVLPMLLSPVLSVLLSVAVFAAFSSKWLRSASAEDVCVCVSPTRVVTSSSSLALQSASSVLVIDSTVNCQSSLAGQGEIVRASRVVHAVHFLSGGGVCFARSVNDTPKIAAMVLVAGPVGGQWGLALTVVGMGLGGLLASRRVAQTMGREITQLAPAHGMIANAVTSTLVIAASAFALPVSTTHVSCGSIFGIGWANGSARWRTIGQIAFAWIWTLPCGAALGALSMWLLRASSATA